MILYSPLSCPSPSSCRRTLGVGLGCNWCGRAGYGENRGAKRSKVVVGGGLALCPSRMQCHGRGRIWPQTPGSLLPLRWPPAASFTDRESTLWTEKEQLQKCQTFPQLKELRAAYFPTLKWKIERRENNLKSESKGSGKEVLFAKHYFVKIKGEKYEHIDVAGKRQSKKDKSENLPSLQNAPWANADSSVGTSAHNAAEST